MCLGHWSKEYASVLFESLGDARLAYRGVLDNAEVGERLWEYDALVLPTRWPGEGYPAVILEAFAHGLPVITTRWQSIPDIVDDGCGILVEPEDASQFASMLNRLHRNPELYARLQQGGS